MMNMHKYIILLAAALILSSCQLDYSDNTGSHRVLEFDITSDMKDGIRRAAATPENSYTENTDESNQNDNESDNDSEERIIHREITEEIRETETHSNSYNYPDGSDDIIWEYE